MVHPPTLFRSLIAVFAPRRFRRELLLDLEEEFRARAATQGEPSARRWYRIQALMSLWPLLCWRLFRGRASWVKALERASLSAPGMDIRYALRNLSGSPVFTLVVVLTFGLGIGANTAAFSLVHSLMLDPLPFVGGDRLVQVWRYETYDGGQRALVPPASPMLAAWDREVGLFQRIGGISEDEFHLGQEDGVVSIPGARVSPEILSMVRATPLLGRLFGQGDDTSGSEGVVLLTESCWAGRFGRDPDIVGRSLEINGELHTVIGVVPGVVRETLEGGFFGSQSKEILLPLNRLSSGGWAEDPNVVAQLAPGLSADRAQDRLDAIQPGIAPRLEGHDEWLPLVVTPRDVLTPDLRRGLWLGLGAVGIVLLIACSNVATLLLARRLGRQEEMRVRMALGAGRLRLAGQLFTENLLLGGAGVVLAVLMAKPIVHAAAWMAGSALPEIGAARLDRVTFAFAAGLGLLTIFTFSLVPILHLRRLGPGGVLVREVLRDPRRPSGFTAHRFLVAGQVALATALVLSAGLLSRSLHRLLSVDPGFETKGLAAVALDLAPNRYDAGEERIAFFDEVVRGLEKAPGVRSVGWSRFVPPRVAGAPGMVNVEGRPPPEERVMEAHAGNWVSSTYFRAVGVPFLGGRPFTQAEISDRAQVVILNRSGAERLWPDGGGGVGARIQLDSDYGPSPWMTVVGIVPDFKAWWLGDRQDRIQIYLPVSDVPPRSGVILVRGEGTMEQLASLVQAQVRQMDPNLPIGEAFWVRDAFHQSVGRQRFQTILVSSFGMLGLLLALLGVYGTSALSVTRRTREIGVRLALGATEAKVIRSILVQLLLVLGAGSAAGLGLSYAAAGLLTDLLWELEARDVPTYILSSGTVVLAGLAASYLSLRRVTKIDPVEALKRE